MKNYCPLMSFAKQYSHEVPCLGENCALAADEAGECLIRQALQRYVSAERTRVAEENGRLRRETELAEAYWAMKKNGVRGMYKDMTPEGDNTPSPEIQLHPPQNDNSHICS